MIPQNRNVTRGIGPDKDVARSRATDAGNADLIPVVLATSTLVDRGSYWEQLSMAPADVDLSRAPLPLILSHNIDGLPVGRVENVRIERGALRGDVRLASTDRAQEVETLIRERVAISVSVGYQVKDGRQVGTDADGIPIYQFPFKPIELSVVSVPADPEAQFFRSFDMNTQTETSTETHLTRSERNTLKVAQAADQARVTEVIDAGEATAKFGGREVATEVLRSGGGLDEFNKTLLERMNKPSVQLASPYEYGAPAFIRSDREYSLARLVASLSGRDRVDCGLEREQHQELARQFGKTSENRVLIPVGALATRSVTKGGTGVNLIATEVRTDEFVDVFRPFAPFLDWIRTMPGLSSEIAIPKKTSSASMTYIGGDDADSLSASDPALSQITMSPKTVGALTKISHKMLIQSQGAEEMVRGDLALAMAQEIAKAIIQGSGTANQPKGLLNWSGIGATTYPTASGPVFATVAALESALATGNALQGNLGYLATPALAIAMKQKDRGTDTGEFVWSPGADPVLGVVNGYKAAMTNHVPTGKIIFANWDDIVLGQWGAIAIEANPYGSTDWAAGTVSIRIITDIDVALRSVNSVAAAIGV